MGTDKEWIINLEELDEEMLEWSRERRRLDVLEGIICRKVSQLGETRTVGYAQAVYISGGLAPDPDKPRVVLSLIGKPPEEPLQLRY